MITDRKEALREVRKAIPNYEDIAPELMADKDFAINAIKAHVEAYKHLPEETKLDRDVAHAAISNLYGFESECRKFISEMPKELFADKDLVEKLIDPYVYSSPKHLLEFGSPEIRDDKDICVKAVTLQAAAFEYISDNMRDNKDVCLCATPTYYPQMSERMRADPDVIWQTVPKDIFVKNSDQNMNYLMAMPDKVLEDKQVILHMMTKNVQSLEHRIPDGMKFDKSDVAKYMLRDSVLLKDGYLKRMEADVFKDDKDFAKKAIDRSTNFYKYMPKEVKSDREIALYALSSPQVVSDVYKELPKDLTDDKSFINEALSNLCPNAHYLYDKVSPEIQNDKDICLQFLKHSNSVFDKFPENVKNDPGFIKEAIKVNPEIKDKIAEQKAAPEKKAPKRDTGLDR